MEIFEKGSESLLQALAVMRDDEEYRRKYGAIPDIINSRRETSIAVLCDMILRMKKEIEGKNKCAKLLEDVAGCWKVIQEDKQRMSQKIRDMEEENVQLKEKVAQLREIINASSNSRSSSYGDSDRERVSESNEEESSGNRENYIDSIEEPISVSQFELPINTGTREMRVQPMCAALTHSENSDQLSDSSGTAANHYAGNADRNETPFQSRFENNSANDNSNGNKPGVSSSTGLNKSSSYASYPRLTSNPYTSLDTSYYNPAQFFQRLSTTSARKSKSKRGGGSGRGRGKKAETQGTSSEGKVVKKRATKSKGTKNNADVELDSGNQPELLDYANNEMDTTTTNCMDQGASGPRQNETPITMGEGQAEESPDKTFYDYTSTFLDETNTSFDI